jgi:hypothetical protein
LFVRLFRRFLLLGEGKEKKGSSRSDAAAKLIQHNGDTRRPNQDFEGLQSRVALYRAEG